MSQIGSEGDGGENFDELSDFQIEIDQEIVLGKVIGSGAFSEVYVADYFGETVAVKKQTMPKTGEIEHYLIRELSILKTVSHPNLIEYMGAASKQSDNTREIYTITEFMAGGDLLQLLVDQTKDLGYKFRVQIASGAAAGLEFLHSQKILHRDIKSANIVLDQFWNCKITDFGFARVADTETGSTRRMTICGTDAYMAPELMFDEEYCETADIYSFGLVLMEIFARKEAGTDGFVTVSPANNFALDFDKIRQEAPADVPPSFLELSVQCCSYEQGERPSMPDVVAWLEDLLKELPEDTMPPPPAPSIPLVMEDEGEEEAEEQDDGGGGVGEEIGSDQPTPVAGTKRVSFVGADDGSLVPMGAPAARSDKLGFFHDVMMEAMDRGILTDEHRRELIEVATELAVPWSAAPQVARSHSSSLVAQNEAHAVADALAESSGTQFSTAAKRALREHMKDVVVHNSARFTKEAMVAVTAITETSEGEQARRDERAASSATGRTLSDASAASTTSSGARASMQSSSGAAGVSTGGAAADTAAALSDEAEESEFRRSLKRAQSGEYANTHKKTSDLFEGGAAGAAMPVPPPSCNTLAEQVIGEQVGPIGETRTTIGALKGRRLGSWLFKKGRQWPKNWQKRYFVLRGLKLSWWRNEPANHDEEQKIERNTMDIGGCTCVVVHDKFGYKITFIPPADSTHDSLMPVDTRVETDRRTTLWGKEVPPKGPPPLQIATRDPMIAVMWLQVLQIPMHKSMPPNVPSHGNNWAR